MADFRLEVFYTVAKRLSFTRAAAELFITQPAVTKHIRELENQYGVKLFERNGNRISLTAAGELLLKNAEDIFERYRQLDFEMSALNDQPRGIMKLGASTTVAYLIAPMLARFRNQYRDVKISLITGNTEYIEHAMLSRDIDLGMIEGRSKDTSISYHAFVRDELVLVCSTKNPMAQRLSIKLNELKTIPLVMREQGSGTLEVIEHALKQHGISMSELEIEIRLGSTESIKQYLMNAPCMAFISIHAITEELKRNELKVIEVTDLTIERDFYLIHRQGKLEGISDMFARFASYTDNFK